MVGTTQWMLDWSERLSGRATNYFIPLVERLVDWLLNGYAERWIDGLGWVLIPFGMHCSYVISKTTYTVTYVWSPGYVRMVLKKGGGRSLSLRRTANVTGTTEGSPQTPARS